MKDALTKFNETVAPVVLVCSICTVKGGIKLGHGPAKNRPLWICMGYLELATPMRAKACFWSPTIPPNAEDMPSIITSASTKSGRMKKRTGATAHPNPTPIVA